MGSRKAVLITHALRPYRRYSFRSSVNVPIYADLFWPHLSALEEHGLCACQTLRINQNITAVHIWLLSLPDNPLYPEPWGIVIHNAAGHCSLRWLVWLLHQSEPADLHRMAAQAEAFFALSDFHHAEVPTFTTRKSCRPSIMKIISVLMDGLFSPPLPQISSVFSNVQMLPVKTDARLRLWPLHEKGYCQRLS